MTVQRVHVQVDDGQIEEKLFAERGRATGACKNSCEYAAMESSSCEAKYGETLHPRDQIYMISVLELLL
jgi:hypothetical protein